MNKIIPIFVIILVVIVSSSYTIPNNIYAYSQEKLTDKETLKVKLVTKPKEPQLGEETRLNIEFINSQSNMVQKNVDYTIRIENNGSQIPVSSTQTHTISGSVSVIVTLEEGNNIIIVDVVRILFQSMPKETVRFDIEIQNKNSVDNIDSIKEGQKESSSENIIPLQFKNHAVLWTEEQIDDDSFVQSIEGLIKEEIISIFSSHIVSDSKNTTREIPQWIKNNVEWWLQGLISDEVFLQNIEYLIKNEIIIVIV